VTGTTPADWKRAHRN